MTQDRDYGSPFKNGPKPTARTTEACQQVSDCLGVFPAEAKS